MEKKKWERPTKEKRKNEKHIAVCQSCLKLSSDKEMTENMYYWVDRKDHKSLECIDCIEKYDYVIHKPYKKTKPKGRPKKIKE